MSLASYGHLWGIQDSSVYWSSTNCVQPDPQGDGPVCVRPSCKHILFHETNGAEIAAREKHVPRLRN